MRRLLILPLAVTGVIAACTPPPAVTAAVGAVTSAVVSTVTNPTALALIGQLVPPPKLANALLAPVFIRSKTGTQPTLEEIKRLLSITNGLLIGHLPKQAALTTLDVANTQSLGGFGILDLGTQTVGTGGVSPYQSAQIAVQNPLQAEDAPIFQANLSALGYRVSSLPTSVDLRTNPQMPAIRNQGRRGTCVLHSAAAVLDYLYANDAANPIKHASVEFLDWLYHVEIKANSQRMKASLWTDNGTYPHLLHLTLRVDGNRETSDDDPYVPPKQGYLGEDQCPYNPNLPNGSANGDFQAEATRRLGATVAGQLASHQPLQTQGAYFFPVKLDLPSLKAALAGGSPVQITYPIYRDDWYNANASNPYIPDFTDDKANSGNVGYHSVCLVGYKDDSSAPGGGWFVVRNSWGTRWGENGYCYVPYSTTLNYGSDTAIAQSYTAPFQAVFSVTPPDKNATPTPAPTPVPSAAPTAQPTADPNNQTIIDTSTVMKNGSYTNDDAKNGTGIDSLSIPNLLLDFLGLLFS